MQRLSGRLREVIVYKNISLEPQGAISEKSPRHIYSLEDNLLHAMSKLRNV